MFTPKKPKEIRLNKERDAELINKVAKYAKEQGHATLTGAARQILTRFFALEGK